MKKILLCLILCLSLMLSGCQIVIVTEPEHTDSPAEGTLTVHFIDVGQADCALIELEDYHMLIDGGNVEDGQLVISYLQQQGVEELDAVVCSHAHEDHVGGLPAVLAVFPTKAVYAPTNTYSSKVFDDFVYYTDQQGLDITIPSPGMVLSAYGVGDYGLKIHFLGPVKSYAETNDTSLVMLVEYGATSFLFTGDMEVAAENDMLDYWENQIHWDVDVLKVGHHGSDTSTSYRLLYETSPEYGVISVGEGNSYGHPTWETLSRLQQAGVTLFRTDQLGHVIATSDGTQVSFTWEDQSAQPGDVQPAEAMVYIGNKNSKTFHAEDCSNLPKKENQVEFSSYAEAIEAGYKPCGSCLG